MMRSRKQEWDDDSFKSQSSRKPRFKKRYVLLTLVLLLLATIGIGIPMIASNRNFVVSSVNKYAGISPLHIDLESISIGWFSPLKIRGLRVTDGVHGQDVATIDEVHTELGISSLARDYSNLKLITLSGIHVAVDIQPGTTSLEEALKPLFVQSSGVSNNSSTTSLMPKGRLRIEQALVRARDSVDSSVWELSIESADIPFPTREQPIPPIAAKGSIRPIDNTSGLPNNGLFAIEFQPSLQNATALGPSNSMPAIDLTIASRNIPLGWWSLVKRRFPEIPVDRLAGAASTQAKVTLLSPESWSANIEAAQIDGLQISAPSLLGDGGAKISQLRLSGGIQMTASRLIAQNTILQSDFGRIEATASIPMPILTPSPLKPWVDGAEFSVRGAVDLAQLQVIAPNLIALQKQARLVSGRAMLLATQRLDAQRQPIGDYQIELGNLVANINGADMKWEQPMSASIEVKKGSEGTAQFKAECHAEFCDLSGNGDLQRGKVQAKVNLDLLQQRLAKLFSLPVQQLSGTAECQMQWQQGSDDRVEANGTLVTTPFTIATGTGQLNEAAWNGTVQVVGRTVQGTLRQLDRGQLALTTQGESLSVEILEPISLIAQPRGVAALPPARTQLTFAGDLASWNRRITTISGMPLGIVLGGRCDLKADALVDTSHVEVTKASFAAESFEAGASGFVIREPRVQGEFLGRVDSQNLGRLQIDRLLVQASSFAIQAMDSATPDGKARQGQAAFRLDPKQLLSAMNTGPATIAGQTTVEGSVTGRMNWVVDPVAIAWQMQTDAEQVRVLQSISNSGPRGSLVGTNSASVTPSLLWEEPNVSLFINGRYDLKSGKVEIPETRLNTSWLACAGKTDLEMSPTMKIVATGQCSYDAATIAARMRPWIGNNVTVTGQRTEPFELIWTSTPSGNWAEALQAHAKVGWSAANVIGIELGEAEVPLTIQNGRFRSQAVIPISQGSLRWNLDGDVAGNPIVIRQAPEMVLENVAITPQMCQGWVKFVAPLLAEVTAVQGRLSLNVTDAKIVPTDSLKQTIEGQLQIHGATVGPGPLADQLLGLVNQIRNLRSGDPTAAANANSSWLTMPDQRIEFSVIEGRVQHRNLQLQAGDIVMQTSGSVGIDGSLDMLASIPIRPEWVQKTPVLSSLAGKSLNLPIRGTLSRPQADLRIFGQLTTQVAEGALQGAIQKQLDPIQKQFDRGLNRILGPLQQLQQPKPQ